MLATHLHFDHAGGFTVRDAAGASVRAFPRAQYVVRRGEWEDATHPHERNRASYCADNFVPLADAGVLQLVDDDADDHAGRARAADRRPHACTIRSSDRVGRQDRRLRRRPDADDGARRRCRGSWATTSIRWTRWRSSRRSSREAIEREYLVFFEHDPDGRRRATSASERQTRVERVT